MWCFSDYCYEQYIGYRIWKKFQVIQVPLLKETESNMFWLTLAHCTLSIQYSETTIPTADFQGRSQNTQMQYVFHVLRRLERS